MIARPTIWRKHNRNESDAGANHSGATRQPRRLAETLQALPRSTPRELRARWQKLIGTAPPGGLSRDLLMRVIADHLQEAALGGLPPRAKRRLAALVRGETGAEASAGIPTLRLKPGSKLVRAWRGKTHTVLVLEDGFEHQGRRYASLTLRPRFPLCRRLPAKSPPPVPRCAKSISNRIGSISASWAPRPLLSSLAVLSRLARSQRRWRHGIGFARFAVERGPIAMECIACGSAAVTERPDLTA